jgi:ParB family chromosome partitioning protein
MSERRRALGRGLGALISSESRSPSPAADARQSTQNGVYEEEPLKPSSSGLSAAIPVDRVDPNPNQPRRRFGTAELERLAASILEHGVLQPIVVRKVGERYELIVGERRWRASRAAGLESIPAVIADMAPQERLEVAIVENVQRHDLNPLELANAYKALRDTGVTQEEIGRKVSQDRSSVANHLRLLELSRDVQEDIEEGRLSMGHAKALLQVSEGALRGRLRDRIVKQGLSVRAAEKLARVAEAPKAAQGAGSAQGLEATDPNLASSLDALQRRYQARIRVKSGRGKGRIEIDYFDSEDFHRIFSLLMGDA